MKLLTLTEVARRLGVSEKTARQFKSELPGVVRVGQRVKYTEDAIVEFIRRGGCRAAGGLMDRTNQVRRCRGSRPRKGTPGEGLCVHSGVRGQCGGCDEWTVLHYPTGVRGGFCAHCCPLCGANGTTQLAAMDPILTSGLTAT